LFFQSCFFPSKYWKEYKSFYTDAENRGCIFYPVDIYFSKLDSEIAGLCVYHFGIIINEELWQKYGPFQRLELMYHELGHCVLDYDHSIGIMNEYIHEENEIKKNWSIWRDKFFHECSNL